MCTVKNHEVKVSIIMPSLNVIRYIKECMESVIHQTLNDIEIICVDAGSIDGTLEILQEYAKKDKRIKVIISRKKSYGYQMNLGMKAARGEYIGIVETDDYIKPEMYDVLYRVAIEHKADIVKSDYYTFYGEKGTRNLNYVALTNNGKYYGKIINPKDDISVFNLAMVTCTGIYRRAYLQKNKVKYNETPGASYQDNGFWHQSFYFADRIYFLKQAFYCYRQDNENSSINNREKIFAGRDEYHYIYNILNEHPDLKKIFICIYTYRKFHNFNYNLHRISDEYKLEFLRGFQQEFLDSEKKGELDWHLFTKDQRTFLQEVMNDPEQVYSGLCGIPIVFATNNNYAPYLGAALNSMMKYADKNKYYAVFILHTRLSVTNQKKLEEMGKGNVKVQCINATKYLPKVNLYQKGYFTDEMYLRILIPKIFQEKDKVLYLDCDLVLRTDISELYELNIEDYAVGMAHNFCTPYRANYVKNMLGILPEKYFNSGVILFNCKKFRDEDLGSKCFSLLAQYSDLECPDQDILNLACKEKIFQINDRWNVSWQFIIQQHINLCDEKEFQRYNLITKKPYIVHFTSEIKPWNEPDRIWSHYFWEAARQSVYYEEILFKAIRSKSGIANSAKGDEACRSDLISDSASYRIERVFTFIPRKVRGGIRCYHENGLQYTIHRIREKFGSLFKS